MKNLIRIAFRALTVTGMLFVTTVHAQTPNVTLSVNVFPTDPLNPDSGGFWTMVAKTDSLIGISAISAYFYDVNPGSVTIESDLGNDPSVGNPLITFPAGTINILYFQNTYAGPIVAGVGTLSKSDGPDPLGNPAWDDATLIFSGTYNATVPSIAVDVGPLDNNTDANTFASVVLGQNTINANTTIVVRVAAIPEPSTLAIAACGITAALAVRRRNRV